jgi:hypothetical protein
VSGKRITGGVQGRLVDGCCDDRIDFARECEGDRTFDGEAGDATGGSDVRRRPGVNGDVRIRAGERRRFGTNQDKGDFGMRGPELRECFGDDFRTDAARIAEGNSDPQRRGGVTRFRDRRLRLGCYGRIRT